MTMCFLYNFIIFECTFYKYFINIDNPFGNINIIINIINILNNKNNENANHC